MMNNWSRQERILLAIAIMIAVYMLWPRVQCFFWARQMFLPANPFRMMQCM